jgi:hypothetical protein
MSAVRSRIHARLNPSLARRVETIRRRTGKSVSEIVKESLERYCESSAADASSPYADLGDLIGCAEGPDDLSQTYKDELRRSLEQKP